MVDTLASVRFDLLAAAADDPHLAQDIQQIRDLRQQIDNLRSQLGNRGYESSDETREHQRGLYATLRQLQQQENALWENLSYKYPALTATQQAPALTVMDAQRLARELDATLVEYYIHTGMVCAFVVTTEDVQYVTLSLVMTNKLVEKMIDWILKMDTTLRNSPMLMGKPLYDWYEAVIIPLRDYLPVGGRVVLAPYMALNLFPFSAARDPQTGHYLCEDYQLAFVPSLASLWVMHQQAAKVQRIELDSEIPHLINVAFAHKPGHPSHLPTLVPSTRSLAESFAPQVKELYQSDATPDAVIRLAQQQRSTVHILHIAAHGEFDMDIHEQSGLELAGGYLTVQRIVSEMPLQQTRLVTLAACLVGRTSVEQSGEAVGITQAFLTAGAKSVVTALWSVEVNATMALFQAFYQQIRAGYPPAVAMRKAMAEIRNTSGWEHPYYWAAWQVYGLAF
jgi:CHAT domain-containing protein